MTQAQSQTNMLPRMKGTSTMNMHMNDMRTDVWIAARLDKQIGGEHIIRVLQGAITMNLVLPRLMIYIVFMNNTFVTDHFSNKGYRDTYDIPNSHGYECSNMKPSFPHHQDDKYKQFGTCRETYNDRNEYSHRQRSIVV